MRDGVLWPWMPRARLLVEAHGATLTVMHGIWQPAKDAAERRSAVGKPGTVLPHLLQNLNRGTRLGLHVVLGGDLTRLFMVTPPAGAKRVEDLRTAAALRFETLFGGTAEDWLVEADWHARKPFLATAVSKSLIEVLWESFAGTPIKLFGIQPLAIDLLGWLSPSKDHWWVLVQDDTAWLAVIERGRVVQCRDTTAVSGGRWHDEPSLQGWMEREALVLGRDLPHELQLIDPRAANDRLQRQRTMGSMQIRSNLEEGLWANDRSPVVAEARSR